MAKTFRPYEPDQIYLFPPSPRDWLGDDHLIFFLSDLVDTLDLSAIYETYTEERGYPPYHPLLMVKILLYGYARGIYSSRKLARACQEDVAFRVLCAGNDPDFRTISDFRKRHLNALSDLFLQVLRLCQKAGMVKLGHVAIDGTKVKANASKHKAMSYARMQEEEKRLKKEIAKLMRESEITDRSEDRCYGADKRGDELPDELAHRESRLKKIQEAKAALEAEAKAAAAAAGAEESEVEAVEPAPKAQRNFTDPESRIMLSSDKSFVQAYNAQAAVDHGSQVIVAADVVQASNDKRALVPMVEQVCENVRAIPEICSADAGYWTEAGLERLDDYGIDAIVAPEKIRHRQWREEELVTGPPPEGLSRKERMRHLLKTEQGRAEYAKRMCTVEPVFGQVKHARGFRQFLLRGHQKVNSEWKLVCTGHNLLKLFAFTRLMALKTCSA
ncbi:MAG: IS1182 family transposase [Gemmatimonadetes bacterium]|nr:IS1182 family transposase [Gemmatimonadota bacterium]